ncbi:MAG: glycosyltransferase [Muribaculaceae bacterium]|nr:glycosyltransferase [Roseburia sp.]MCM1432030.1 glycosyltransferase [Muribaculaceae bacterium]MCM1493717.1 glycosyltransferase [Muribaculaceae bacterium]
MIKLIFVMPSLRIGGIEQSLINLLNRMDLNKYSVALKLFHCNTEYSKQLDDRIELIDSSFLLDILSMTLSEAKRENKIKYLLRGMLSLLCMIFGSNFVYSIAFLFEKKTKFYDVAISYSNNITTRGTYFGANKYVIKKCVSKKKITWLHVDYEAQDMNCKINNNEYKKFDHVVAVSKAGKSAFLKYVPGCRNKTSVIYNIISNGVESGACFTDERLHWGGRNIITVGRIDSNKNQLMAVKVAAILKKGKVSFKWWLVGDGQMREEVEEAIKMNGLIDDVIITGYIPLIQNSLDKFDIFVSTSKSESYCMAIAEALNAGIPTVALWYPELDEMVLDGKNGYVAKDEKGMSDIIKQLIMDENFYEAAKKRTKCIVSNESIIKEFDDLIRDCVNY